MLGDWEQLWERTCIALTALAKAGFMINLRKTKFLTQKTKLLGVQIQPAGYYLGNKCLKGWQDLAIPTTQQELMVILGRLVWASPFIPQYKQIVAPLEALLSRKTLGKWE